MDRGNTVKDLIEYLDGFDKEKAVVFLPINPGKRIRYDVQHVTVITDSAFPFFALELGNEIPFDEEETRAAEGCEMGGRDGQ